MKTDVTFVHPPSIYNFRSRELRTGPISDVVPSTPVFEMYPIGLISMLNYLTTHGYSARISNLAVLMLSSDRFDKEKYLKNLDSDIFGVDLHWLPHVHGAINVVRTLKRLHPQSKVVLGGYSASYFAEEILQTYPEVDYVLKGDLQEKSMLQLVDYTQGKGSIENIENLLYRSNGCIKSNKRSDDIERMNDVFLNYDLLMKNALKYHDVRGHLPFLSWIHNPMAMTLIQHGCQMNCAFCGGSYYSYKKNFYPHSPITRDINRIVDEVELVHKRLGAPIFIAGDLYLAGEKYYTGFINEIKRRGIDIPLLTEYFVPPPLHFYQALRTAFPEFTSEISPESSIEKIRMRVGKAYTNNDLEKSIKYAGENGCRKYDVYFSIGVPTQEPEDVFADVRYSEKLLTEFNTPTMQISAFTSPLTPFLDPGSLIYEFPDNYGYRIRASSIQDYYDLLDFGTGWEDFLNYETDKMNRRTIEETTYIAAKMMAEIRYKGGWLTETEHARIVGSIQDYIEGKPVGLKKRTDNHLTYMSKEIQWSRKHHLTFSSFLIYLYKTYHEMKNSDLMGRFMSAFQASEKNKDGVEA